MCSKWRRQCGAGCDHSLESNPVPFQERSQEVWFSLSESQFLGGGGRGWGACNVPGTREEWDPSLSSTCLSSVFSAMIIKLVPFLISVTEMPNRSNLGKGRFIGFQCSSVQWWCGWPWYDIHGTKRQREQLGARKVNKTIEAHSQWPHSTDQAPSQMVFHLPNQSYSLGQVFKDMGL